MNFDFLIYTVPNHNITIQKLWGQIIKIPKIVKKKKNIPVFLNCWKWKQNQISADKFQQIYDQKIPCLFLDSCVTSQYIFLYFHSSGQDIALAKKFLQKVRNGLQINVLAMQYPGYKFYPGQKSTQHILENTFFIYDYLVNNLKFQENKIIICGKSIGTGPALKLAGSKKNIACLALISPFTCLKDIAKDFIGQWSSSFLEQKYNNIEHARKVQAPIFILHGKKDNFVKVQQAYKIKGNCINSKKVEGYFPQDMTHTEFDFYQDFVQRLALFLCKNKINIYKQTMKGPIIPDDLYKNIL